LEVEGVNVVDKDGRIRIKLPTHEDGSAGLLILDHNGQKRVGVALDPIENCGLYLYDRSDIVRATFGLLRGADPIVQMTDGAPRLRAELTSDSRGTRFVMVDQSTGAVWEPRNVSRLILCLALGTAAGFALGLLAHNLLIGLAVGVSMGILWARTPKLRGV
jgi:hypothetical protein